MGEKKLASTRRIVTGLVDGKSTFICDETVEPTTTILVPDGAFTRVFGTANLSLPNDGSNNDIESYFPPDGGVTLTIVTLPPDSSEPPPEDFDITPLVNDAMEKLPGLMETFEMDGSMMHTSETIDIVTLMAGRLILELDDGQTREVSAGDVVIQNGTRHAWRNPFGEAAVLHSISLGVAPKT